MIGKMQVMAKAPGVITSKTHVAAEPRGVIIGEAQVMAETQASSIGTQVMAEAPCVIIVKCT